MDRKRKIVHRDLSDEHRPRVATSVGNNNQSFVGRSFFDILGPDGARTRAEAVGTRGESVREQKVYIAHEQAPKGQDSSATGLGQRVSYAECIGVDGRLKVHECARCTQKVILKQICSEPLCARSTRCAALAVRSHVGSGFF